MTQPLQIPRWHERVLVRTADALLSPLRLRFRSHGPRHVRRVLLLRLERIGDLLMVIDAIRHVRATWPDAEIDLVVGAWNRPVAGLIPGITRLETISVPWLSRGDSGERWPTLIRKARNWHTRNYDLVINFEPDIRSNLLAWLSGAPLRVGYGSGGGGALLTTAEPWDATVHGADNAIALVERAARLSATSIVSPAAATPRLRVPDEATARARTMLERRPRPWIGVHTSGGRESKQWHVGRFAAVARRLAQARGGTIVLTGSQQDRVLVAAVERELQDTAVANVAGRLDLIDLAGLLRHLDVLVTGDTGPMHLAAAVGTPVVALFGPSDPVRYGPRAARERLLFSNVACRPCGQVRRPPRRCRGHVPDCLDGIGADQVVDAALDLLDDPARPAPQEMT